MDECKAELIRYKTAIEEIKDEIDLAPEGGPAEDLDQALTQIYHIVEDVQRENSDCEDQMKLKLDLEDSKK